MTGLDLTLIEDAGRAIGIEIDTAQLQQNAVQYIRNRPSFFAPFKNGSDFLNTLTTPFALPLGGALLTGLLGAASGIAAAVCVCGFITAGVAALANNIDSRNTALTVGTIGGIVALVAPLLSALIAVCAVLATAEAFARLISRIGASIINPIVTVVNSCSPSEPDNSVIEYSPSLG